MSFGDLSLNQLLSLNLNWSDVMEETTSENALIAYAVACGAISAFFAYHLGTNFKIALPLAAGLSIPSVIFLMRLLDTGASEEGYIWSHIFPLVVCVSAMLGCLLSVVAKMKLHDGPEPILLDLAEDDSNSSISEENRLPGYYPIEGSLPSSLGSIPDILFRVPHRVAENPEVFFLLRGKYTNGFPDSPGSLTLSPWITPMTALQTQSILPSIPDDSGPELVPERDEMRFADEAPCFGRTLST